VIGAGEPSFRRIDESNLGHAVAWLMASHPPLAAVVDRHGLPPLWARNPGFATLVLFILEQQVSLASARAAFDRLLAASGEIHPDRFLELSDSRLRDIGFSRQKAGYARGLAAGLADGSITLPDDATSDDAARRDLLAIKGVGPWTAECYLLFVLGRPDVWPTGDRALQVSMGRVLSLPEVPTAADADEIAAAWRPLRAVAARLLWHDYLSHEP
jgi:DNA-3-methyladenine glycosylase II